MFRKVGYLRSPLFIVVFALIFFVLTEMIILFFERQNFEALKRLWGLLGLIILFVFDYWLREVKFTGRTKFIVQIVIAIPLLFKFLYPYSKEFYDKVVLKKTFYQAQIELNFKRKHPEFIAIIWNDPKSRNMQTISKGNRNEHISFSFDTTNIIMVKNAFELDYFENIKYSYKLNDSLLLKGEIETDKNPYFASSTYLIGKTKYEYHVFKVIYDSNDEPYLIQAINFETDRATMQKVTGLMNEQLQPR